MKPIDYLILVLALLLIIFTIFHNIRKKIKGKSSCPYGQDCQGCQSKDCNENRDKT